MGNWSKGHQGFTRTTTGEDPPTINKIPKREAGESSEQNLGNDSQTSSGKSLDQMSERLETKRRAETEHLIAQTTPKIASDLHEDWRASRKQDDGTFAPRLKPDGNGGEVDIANTAYSDLPPKWQAENKAAAEGAARAVLENPDDLERAADAVHKDWLTRNGDSAPPWQKQSYKYLPEEEKEKDRVVARAAAERLGKKY